MRRIKPDGALIHELKALTRDQEALIQSQTRLVNQPTACLKAYYLAALKLFTKLQQHCTLVFLQTYPTASVEKIEAIPRKGHHCHPTKVAEQIGQTLHQPHLVADVITTRTKSRLMLALIGHSCHSSNRLPLMTHADSEIFQNLGDPMGADRLVEDGQKRSGILPHGGNLMRAEVGIFSMQINYFPVGSGAGARVYPV